MITQTEIIVEFLKQNQGQINTKEAKENGISTKMLSWLYSKGKLDRIARGVYIKPYEFGDDVSALQFRFSKGVYFKDTSLFLHGMIDRTPDTYEMNFPLTYSYSADLDVPLKIYRQKNELYDIGIEEIKSPGGHYVVAYNVERTLCDILRSRDRSDAETIKQAMNSYVKISDKKLDRLTEYSKIFKVQKEISNYMEVLL